MLKGFTLKFDVIGNGKRALQKIKQSYKETQQLLKKPLAVRFGNVLKNPFTGIKKSFNLFSSYSTKVFNNAQKKASSLMGTFRRLVGVLSAGLTIKTGLEGASNIEQYRNTLETVLKDSILAQKKLAWASRLANKTPFETEEIINGMTKMQSYGMEGDRVLKSTGKTYLEMIGDMASAMNKPFEQAVEALADSRTGELERLKEFGITKNMIGDFAKLKGYGDLFNNKGQIKDLNLFNKALFELMNSKYGGAMEKQARTFKGAMSTIKGVLKSGLATLIGMDEFGNAIKNSPFQLIRDKVLIPLADLLVKWQEDGTFIKWAEGFSSGIEKVIKTGKNIISFCIKWKEVVIPVVSALAGLFIIEKIAYMIGALKVALAALSFNPVVAGIGLVIAGTVALYRNWDKVRAFFSNFMENYSGIFNILIPSKIVFDALKSFWNAWDSNLGIIENIKNSFTAFFESIKNSIVSTIESVKGLGNVISNLSPIKKVKKFFGFESEEVETDGSHRTGLSYVPHDNYIAKLHEGERVLTKRENEQYSATKKSSGNNYVINITVNNTGRETDWNKLGEFIVRKIKSYEEEKEIAEGLI